MDDQQQVRYITSLQARMNRMETLMQQLLTVLENSGSLYSGERIQMQNMLQELQGNPEFRSQERPEMEAIRQALLSGNKITAIKLYRSVYGVSLKEAQDALSAM
jgi:ribosomal protein L7/L12